MLLAPPIRAARDEAYHAAVGAGHSPAIAAAAAAAATTRWWRSGRPRSCALDRQGHRARRVRGLALPYLLCDCPSCGALLEEDAFSPGAALAGGLAYGGAALVPKSAAACEAAAIAAAAECVEAAEGSPDLEESLAAGELPPKLQRRAYAAGAAAAEAIALGASSDAAAAAGRAAGHAVAEGFSAKAAAAAGEAALKAYRMGYSSAAVGEAGRGRIDGLAVVLVRGGDEGGGGGVEDGGGERRRGAQSGRPPSGSFRLQLLDEQESPLQAWDLGLHPSSAQEEEEEGANGDEGGA